MYKKTQLSQQNKPNLFTNASDLSQQPQFQGSSSRDNYLETDRFSKSKSPKTVSLLQSQQVDLRRVNRAKYQFQQKQQDGEQQPQRKQAIKMNLFRESARQHQRQFHQQNHEYLRMFSVIASSALASDKFKINTIRQGRSAGQNKSQNKTSAFSQNYATVHLQLHTQMTSSLINYKFPMKDTYNTVPFKKQSFEFESRQILDPKYEFFVFEKPSLEIDQIKHELKNVQQQGLTSEFKSSVIRTVGGLNYFEFLDMINMRRDSVRSKGVEYPKQIIDIAHQAEAFEINSDQEEFYTRRDIIITQQQTDQRIVSCEEGDLEDSAPSVYFQLSEEYTLYKKYRSIEFRFLKIYDKDISINTDIRNIISSEKIYLIELVKELDLYVQLSAHSPDIQIMREIHKQMKRKSEEFLRLLCGYTESKILKQYNIENYHEKIMIFVEKSIRYGKEIQKLDEHVLDEFPILKIWYEIPQVLFGYSRETLHTKYYDLVRATLQYEEWISEVDLERELSKKRPGIKYPQ